MSQENVEIVRRGTALLNEGNWDVLSSSRTATMWSFVIYAARLIRQRCSKASRPSTAAALEATGLEGTRCRRRVHDDQLVVTHDG